MRREEGLGARLWNGRDPDLPGRGDVESPAGSVARRHGLRRRCFPAAGAESIVRKSGPGFPRKQRDNKEFERVGEPDFAGHACQRLAFGDGYVAWEFVAGVRKLAVSGHVGSDSRRHSRIGRDQLETCNRSLPASPSSLRLSRSRLPAGRHTLLEESMPGFLPLSPPQSFRPCCWSSRRSLSEY